MKVCRESRLYFDMVILAKKSFEKLTDEEIQQHYGSDYYIDLKKYLESTEPIEIDWVDLVVYIVKRMPKASLETIEKILDLEEAFLKEKGVIW